MRLQQRHHARGRRRDPVAAGDEGVRRRQRGEEDGALVAGREEARQGDDEEAAEDRAEDACVAPRQRVAEAAAQDDGDAQHEPVRMRSPRQREREVVGGRERERHAHGVAQHERIGAKVRAQRAQRPAFGSDEGLQLRRRERQRLDLAAQRRMDAGDIGVEATDAAAQRRQQPRARVPGGDLQLVAGGGERERCLHRRFRNAAVAQRVGGDVEVGGDAAQRARGALEDLATGGVAARQVDVQAAREQRVAQVDEAQQQGDVALPVAAVHGRIEKIARGLQPLGERRFAADPDVDRRRLAGLDPVGEEDAGARSKQLRGRAQRGDQGERAVARLQHGVAEQRPAEIEERPARAPGGDRELVLGRRHGHREDHREDRRERHRAGARTPGQRQHGDERDHGHDDAERERMHTQQVDGDRGEDAEEQCRADAVRGARRDLRKVGDADGDRAAQRQRRGMRAGDAAHGELDAADAERGGDAVDEIRRQQPPRPQPRGQQPRGCAQSSISFGSQACTFWRCSPRPAMPRRISSPAFRNTGVGFMPRATPGGVPVVMRSPGHSVMKRLQ